MDINIWGIGLNDALCPNNHVLEEFENSLCTGVESVISGNLGEPLPVISEPVVDLSPNDEFTPILEKLNDSENLTQVEAIS